MRAETAALGLVGQQGLLPRPSDPRLWLLEVRPGSERQLAVALLNRAIREPLLVKSAFTQDHLAVRLASQCELDLLAPALQRCQPGYTLLSQHTTPLVWYSALASLPPVFVASHMPSGMCGTRQACRQPIRVMA